MQVHNWSDGYHAIRQRAEALRGFVEINTGTDDAASWPRTTNTDVIAIAAVISPELKARPILALRWRRLLGDLEKRAIPGDPSATYASNRAFWSAIAELCAHLDAAPVPELWSALADHLGEPALRNAGPREDGPFAHFEGVKTYDDLFNAQRKFLGDKRGADKLPPPAGFGGGLFTVPRSTNQDVLQIATYWGARLVNAKRVMGYDAAVAKWKVAIADVDHFAKSGKPGDVYLKNNEFWRSALDVAIQVAIGDESPTQFSMFVDAVKDSVTHLPENIGHAASAGADLLASAAHAVGKVANEAGKGLFAGFGTPLLIGGGLIGLYLISRSRGHSED